MEKVRVSAVSYTNTLPFIYGLQHSPVISQIELSLDVPSSCAHKLIHNEADLGIVPVAALLEIPQAEVVSDYCLGASGAVNSVFIFSEKPIEDIESLRLDGQSRTSNGLAQILLRDYWNLEVQVVKEGKADAYVEIGDRTFGKQYAHPYAYDLSWYWQKLTGLPFAFAAWVANKPLEVSFIESFNGALAYGLTQRDVLINQLPKRLDFDYRQYLMESIDYRYDEGKKKAVTEFLRLMKTLHREPINP
ncbi:menaquinone biosynthetic enzyme MqnA/MqnD family protein [Parapedobacter indicus]|uniref:Chorismate dehydratase n=1 Tax=Parapedobacter indicus TaxID=1477437 RepID=A0A1I3R000_9SPHI|nr:menaquinone biosynthesis protein [Parapedobacter indicus]PPL00287.1 chorismate dehydratase [Parapedobacter indicus]SFJ38851.1 chorismate dehydratase [Parapedobacter indicus]